VTLSSWSSSPSTTSALSKVANIQALTDALRIQSVALASLTPATASEGTSADILGEALRKAQRAILLRPWELKGWQTLAYLRAKALKM
jgi:superkiller protein 3